MIIQGSRLWNYLSVSQQGLARDGMFLLEDSGRHEGSVLEDYSYIVFPFAKLYEGFLKKLFLDLGMIGDREYRSDHFRIGKALSPHMAGMLRGRSVFAQVESRYGVSLATELWQTWKNGRNLVFHYFPHNLRALTLPQAKALIEQIIYTMDAAVSQTNVRPHGTPN